MVVDAIGEPNPFQVGLKGCPLGVLTISPVLGIDLFQGLADCLDFLVLEPLGRHQRGTPEQRLFEGISRMIAARKNIPAFADFNNRELIDTGNPHLFVFMRSNPFELHDDVLIVANFDSAPQTLNLADLGNRSQFGLGRLRDLCTGEAPAQFRDRLVVPPLPWVTIVRPQPTSSELYQLPVKSGAGAPLANTNGSTHHWPYWPSSSRLKRAVLRAPPRSTRSPKATP
mgnify:CR=1 FL=1